MPSKGKPAAMGTTKTSETAIVRSLKDLLKEYEMRAQKYETSTAKSIKKQFKKAIDDDKILTLFLVDPQDRRPVEYWDDEKMIKALSGDIEEAFIGKKRRVKMKQPKEDKPLGERGCRVLCSGLLRSRYLVHLSVSYCGFTKQCGLWIGNLLVETAIREIILDGNPLEAEGVIALLSQLSEAAESEGFERTEEVKRKELAVEEAKRAARPTYDLNSPDGTADGASKEPSASPEGVKSEKKPASSGKQSRSQSGGKKDKKKGKKRGKKGKKGHEPPPAGPQISVLKLADTGINHMGRGGNFAPVRCMQLLKSIITHGKDLQEIDLFANEVGNLGARQILEGVLARKDGKLPQIGIRMGHRINQDTFDMIHKLAPGPKKKGKGKKSK